MQSFQICFYPFLRHQRIFGKNIVVLGDVLFLAAEPFSKCGLKEQFGIQILLFVIPYYIIYELFDLRIAQMHKSLFVDTCPVSINSFTMSHTFSTSSTKVQAIEITSCVYSSV